ncbi:MAG: hypothetical protein ACLFXM_11855 [Acidimicrobiia bacterium]
MHGILAGLGRHLALSWRRRRTEEGGLSDEVAMIGLMLAAAVIVGGLVLAALTGAVSRLDFGF